MKRGYFVEGQQWLMRALTRGTESPPGLRAKVLSGLANTTYFQGDIAGALRYAQQSADLAREAGDPVTTAFTVGLQSIAAAEGGEIELAVRLAVESQALALTSGVAFSAGPARYVLGFVALREGRHDDAGRIWTEGAAAVGDLWAVAIFLSSLAGLRVVEGRFAETRTICTDAINICQEIADPRGLAWCLDILATMHAAEGRPLQAARVWGGAERLLQAAAAVAPPTHKFFRELYLARAKEAAGEPAFEAALSEGRAMPTKSAVQSALE